MQWDKPASQEADASTKIAKRHDKNQLVQSIADLMITVNMECTTLTISTNTAAFEAHRLVEMSVSGRAASANDSTSPPRTWTLSAVSIITPHRHSTVP